jgi:hypothetical protein
MLAGKLCRSAPAYVMGALVFLVAVNSQAVPYANRLVKLNGGDAHAAAKYDRGGIAQSLRGFDLFVRTHWKPLKVVEVPMVPESGRVDKRV